MDERADNTCRFKPATKRVFKLIHRLYYNSLIHVRWFQTHTIVQIDLPTLASSHKKGEEQLFSPAIFYPSLFIEQASL
jgi:hypothetical protein